MRSSHTPPPRRGNICPTKVTKTAGTTAHEALGWQDTGSTGHRTRSGHGRTQFWLSPFSRQTSAFPPSWRGAREYYSALHYMWNGHDPHVASAHNFLGHCHCIPAPGTPRETSRPLLLLTPPAGITPRALRAPAQRWTPLPTRREGLPADCPFAICSWSSGQNSARTSHPLSVLEATGKTTSSPQPFQELIPPIQSESREAEGARPRSHKATGFEG